MGDPITTPECTFIGLNNRRDVNLTVPWFIPKCKYPPRHGNVLLPLINGERAFASVHAAIAAARKSVDIISWGFDPSMRLVRPGGLRVGDLLRARAKAGVEVRVLAWKNAIANFEENNIIGDGWFGSGGGSAGAGSGMGSTGAGDAKGNGGGFNEYGGKRSGRGSAGVLTDDPDARAYNRQWFKDPGKGLSFRTRDFGGGDRDAIFRGHVDRHGRFGRLEQRSALYFATHHQKVILVDYERPDDAVGFVMGHNLLRDYWDDDEHAYWSDARLGFGPWQDLSSCVFGPVLWDLNENFCTAWTKAQPWIGSDQPIGAQRLQIKPEAFIEPAGKRGAPELAQITRTQVQDNDKSILESYRLALANARDYLYFENQYFRSTELAMHLRTMRRKLKAGGWKRDLHVFVVTNVPLDSGRITTYEMLRALGKAERMPQIERQQGDVAGGERALRRADLEGLNVVVCTLCANTEVFPEPQAYETGRIDDMVSPK